MTCPFTDCELCAQAAAIWESAANADDTPAHHFTDAEERAIDQHLAACEGCRRCGRSRP